MKKGFKKYFTFVLILLVFMANISYAVTTGLCAMSMDGSMDTADKSSCCCAQSMVNTAGCEIKPTASKNLSFNSESCCKVIQKEFTNTSDFSLQGKQETAGVLIDFILKPVLELIPLSSYNHSFDTGHIGFRINKDIPVLHSSFLI